MQVDLVGAEDWEARQQAYTRTANDWIRAASKDRVRGHGRFRCECGDGNCELAIELTGAEYESVRASAVRFVLAPNHEHPRDHVVAEHERYTIVEKLVGPASRHAGRSYPR